MCLSVLFLQVSSRALRPGAGHEHTAGGGGVSGGCAGRGTEPDAKEHEPEQEYGTHSLTYTYTHTHTHT